MLWGDEIFRDSNANLAASVHMPLVAIQANSW